MTIPQHFFSKQEHFFCEFVVSPAMTAKELLTLVQELELDKKTEQVFLDIGNHDTQERWKKWPKENYQAFLRKIHAKYCLRWEKYDEELKKDIVEARAEAEEARAKAEEARAEAEETRAEAEGKVQRIELEKNELKGKLVTISGEPWVTSRVYGDKSVLIEHEKHEMNAGGNILLSYAKLFHHLIRNKVPERFVQSFFELFFGSEWKWTRLPEHPFCDIKIEESPTAPALFTRKPDFVIRGYFEPSHSIVLCIIDVKNFKSNTNLVRRCRKDTAPDLQKDGDVVVWQEPSDQLNGFLRSLMALDSVDHVSVLRVTARGIDGMLRTGDLMSHLRGAEFALSDNMAEGDVSAERLLSVLDQKADVSTVLTGDEQASHYDNCARWLRFVLASVQFCLSKTLESGLPLVRNRYLLVRSSAQSFCLGQGRSGVAFKAWDTHHRRYVCLKVSADSMEEEYRILKDIASKKQSLCPNVHTPTVVDYFSVDIRRSFRLFMKYEQLYPQGDHGSCLVLTPVGEGDLSKVSRQGWKTWLSGTLKALHFQLGLVHRDIRPSNVVVFDKEPYLIDFLGAVDWRTTQRVYHGAWQSGPSYLKPRPSLFKHTPADDLEEIVNACLLLADPGETATTVQLECLKRKCLRLRQDFLPLVGAVTVPQDVRSAYDEVVEELVPFMMSHFGQAVSRWEKLRKIKHYTAVSSDSEINLSRLSLSVVDV